MTRRSDDWPVWLGSGLAALAGAVLCLYLPVIAVGPLRWSLSTFHTECGTTVGLYGQGVSQTVAADCGDVGLAWTVLAGLGACGVVAAVVGLVLFIDTSRRWS